MIAELKRCLFPSFGVVLVALLMAEMAHAGTSSIEARYYVADWHLESPLGTAGGVMIALIDHQGRWRLDIGIEDGATVTSEASILKRQGDGWTLMGETGLGISQTWHAPWRHLSAQTTASLKQLIHQVFVDRPSAATLPFPEPRRWRQGQRWEHAGIVFFDLHELAVFQEKTGQGTAINLARRGELRSRLSVRGLGRGGEGLRLHLCWAGSVLVLSSARWPGKLSVERITEERLDVSPEAFLPLWPLADFLP